MDHVPPEFMPFKPAGSKKPGRLARKRITKVKEKPVGFVAQHSIATRLRLRHLSDIEKDVSPREVFEQVRATVGTPVNNRRRMAALKKKFSLYTDSNDAQRHKFLGRLKKVGKEKPVGFVAQGIRELGGKERGNQFKQLLSSVRILTEREQSLYSNVFQHLARDLGDECKERAELVESLRQRYHQLLLDFGKFTEVVGEEVIASFELADKLATEVRWLRKICELRSDGRGEATIALGKSAMRVTSVEEDATDFGEYSGLCIQMAVKIQSLYRRYRKRNPIRRALPDKPFVPSCDLLPSHIPRKHVQDLKELTLVCHECGRYHKVEVEKPTQSTAGVWDPRKLDDLPFVLRVVSPRENEEPLVELADREAEEDDGETLSMLGIEDESVEFVNTFNAHASVQVGAPLEELRDAAVQVPKPKVKEAEVQAVKATELKRTQTSVQFPPVDAETQTDRIRSAKAGSSRKLIRKNSRKGSATSDAPAVSVQPEPTPKPTPAVVPVVNVPPVEEEKRPAVVSVVNVPPVEEEEKPAVVSVVNIPPVEEEEKPAVVSVVNIPPVGEEEKPAVVSVVNIPPVEEEEEETGNLPIEPPVAVISESPVPVPETPAGGLPSVAEVADEEEGEEEAPTVTAAENAHPSAAIADEISEEEEEEPEEDLEHLHSCFFDALQGLTSIEDTLFRTVGEAGEREPTASGMGMDIGDLAELVAEKIEYVKETVTPHTVRRYQAANTEILTLTEELREMANHIRTMEENAIKQLQRFTKVEPLESVKEEGESAEGIEGGETARLPRMPSFRPLGSLHSQKMQFQQPDPPTEDSPVSKLPAPLKRSVSFVGQAARFLHESGPSALMQSAVVETPAVKALALATGASGEEMLPDPVEGWTLETSSSFLSYFSPDLVEKYLHSRHRPKLLEQTSRVVEGLVQRMREEVRLFAVSVSRGGGQNPQSSCSLVQLKGRGRPFVPSLDVPEFVFRDLEQQVGLKGLVAKHGLSLIQGCCRYRSVDPEIRQFTLLLQQSWGGEEAAFYLQLLDLFELLREGSRIAVPGKGAFVDMRRMKCVMGVLFGTEQHNPGMFPYLHGVLECRKEVDGAPSIGALLTKIFALSRFRDDLGTTGEDSGTQWIAAAPFAHLLLIEYRRKLVLDVVEEWHLQAFAKADNNGDGYVTRGEAFSTVSQVASRKAFDPVFRQFARLRPLYQLQGAPSAECPSRDRLADFTEFGRITARLLLRQDGTWALPPLPEREEDGGEKALLALSTLVCGHYFKILYPVLVNYVGLLLRSEKNADVLFAMELERLRVELDSTVKSAPAARHSLRLYRAVLGRLLVHQADAQAECGVAFPTVPERVRVELTKLESVLLTRWVAAGRETGVLQRFPASCDVGHKRLVCNSSPRAAGGALLNELCVEKREMLRDEEEEVSKPK